MTIQTSKPAVDRRAVLLGIADLIDAGRQHIREATACYFEPAGSRSRFSLLEEEVNPVACGCALGAAFIGARLRLGASLSQALASDVQDMTGCVMRIEAALGLDDLSEIEIQFPRAGYPWLEPVVEQINNAHVSGELTTAEIAEALRRLADEETP